MKKTLLTMTVMAAIMISANLSAQTDNGITGKDNKAVESVEAQTVQQSRPNFVDYNGDGICDSRQGRGMRNRNFVDANNDSICDNFTARRGNRQGRNFVDTNNDGVCDNFVLKGSGRQGRNFVDANNDGVCDNFANRGSGKGLGRGNGHCCGKGRGFRQRFGQQ